MSHTAGQPSAIPCNILRRACAALLYLPAAAVGAQTTTSSVAGHVTATGGAPLTAATIAVTHKPTGARYGTLSSADGSFLLANLKPGGPYTITVRRVGFRPLTRDSVFLVLGRTFRADAILDEVAATLSAVTVTADKSEISATASTGPSTAVDRHMIEVVPTLSRSLQDMTRLTPSGNANSFAGTNFRYNNITIDGAATNDVVSFSNSYGGVSGAGPTGTPGAGAKSQPISLDAIDQVQVVLAPFDVTLGNFTGASINAVTRSGSNERSGSLYTFGRNELLTGRSADDARSNIPAYHDYQVGGRLGGPMQQDKAFYFLNAEVARRHEPVQFAPGDPGTVVDAVLAATLNDSLRARLGTDAGATGPYAIDANSTKLFGRVDLNLSEAHKLSFRHNFVSAQAGQLTRGIFNVNFGSQDFIQKNTSNSTVAELKSTFANGVANSFVGGLTITRDRRDPLGPILPQVEITGPSGSAIFLGTNREAAIFRINTNVLELTDNITLHRDKHTITLGSHNEFYGIQYFFQNAWNGRWQYSSLANFNANKPSRIRGTYAVGDNSYAAVAATPSADFKVLWPSAYVQDEIAFSDRLHVTPGIRIDMPMFPDKPGPNTQFLNTSVNGASPFAQYNESSIGGNVYVAPRVSFNWDVFGDQRLQARGGTGVFTGRVPFAWYAYAYYNNGVRFNNVDCRPGATSGCAGNGATVPLVPGAQLKTLQSGVYEMNVIDNHFKLPTIERSSFGLDWKATSSTVLTLEGTYTKSLQDVKFLNVGLKDSTVASAVDGRPVFLGSPVQLRVNPNITSVFLLTNTQSGDRYSVTGQAQQSFGNLRGSMAYTYGQSRDVSNGIRNSPQSNWEYNQTPDPRSPGVAHSNFDLRHRVVSSLLWNTEWKPRFPFSASFVFTGSSGAPFTYIYANDYNRDGSSNNDLVYVPRDLADARIVPAAGDTRTPDQIWSQLDAFINSQPGLADHRGQITGRNSGRTPWNRQLDLRLSQDLPVLTKDGNRLQLTLDVINVGAMVSTTWGRQYFVPNENNYNFPTMRVTKTDASGAPIGFSFDGVQNNVPWQYDPLNSRYQAQLGARWSF